MILDQAGCEVKITEHAAKEFKSMCEDENKLLENSYLRVGANSGGCSGWKFTIKTEDTVDSTDTLFEENKPQEALKLCLFETVGSA